LHPYWQRWEKSNTEQPFFQWLDEGPGSFIDLPQKPRRLLEEWKILYLNNEQQKLFKVSIKDGVFTWDFDGTAVTLPGSLAKSERQQKIDALVKDKLQIMEERDGALHALKDEVEKHRRNNDKEPPDVQTLCRDPKLKGLLWQLRDEHFKGRLDPPKEQQESDPGSKPGPREYNNQEDFKESDDFRENLTWDDMYQAVMHDLGESKEKKDAKEEKLKKEGKQGKEKKQGEKEDKGIFVVDKYDNIYCSIKVRGIIQHSSFVRGHSVKFAGGLRISGGTLIEIRPHSGHYRPDPESLKKLREAWKKKGVNYDEVDEKPFEKEEQ